MRLGVALRGLVPSDKSFHPRSKPCALSMVPNLESLYTHHIDILIYHIPIIAHTFKRSRAQIRGPYLKPEIPDAGTFVFHGLGVCKFVLHGLGVCKAEVPTDHQKSF